MVLSNLQGPPLTKAQILHSDALSWQAFSGSWDQPLIFPLPGSHLAAQHLSSLCPGEAQQPDCCGRGRPGSDSLGPWALPHAGAAYGTVEGEKGKLSLFLFLNLRASSEPSR